MGEYPFATSGVTNRAGDLNAGKVVNFSAAVTVNATGGTRGEISPSGSIEMGQVVCHVALRQRDVNEPRGVLSTCASRNVLSRSAPGARGLFVFQKQKRRPLK